MLRIPPWICVYINKKFQIFEFPRTNPPRNGERFFLENEETTLDRKVSTPPTNLETSGRDSLSMHLPAEQILAGGLVFPNLEESRESWEELSQSQEGDGRRNFIVTVSLLPGRQITSSPTLSTRNFCLAPPFDFTSRVFPSLRRPISTPPPSKVDKGLFWAACRSTLFTVDAR